MLLKDRITALMEEQELTQTQLADKARVSQNAIYKILAGKTLKPRNITDIATALGVTAEYLANGDLSSNSTGTQSLGIELSEKELLIVEMLRSLTPDQQNEIIRDVTKTKQDNEKIAEYLSGIRKISKSLQK